MVWYYVICERRDTIIGINVDDFRNSVSKCFGLDLDGRYKFYYDESNNCRKFSINDEQFNVPPEEDFVLAGVVYEGDSYHADFAELWDNLKFQKNVKEIKFNRYFSNGDFLKCMDSNRMTVFLNWLYDSNLYMHYSHVNNYYYAIVEIIDSIMTSSDLEEYKFDYISLKNTLYKMLLKHKKEFMKIMYTYQYPNIKTGEISVFCHKIINLFGSSYELSMEEKFIRGMVKRAEDKESLIFLQNNKDYIMQDGFIEFYIHPIELFKYSQHIFDEEEEIIKIIKQYNFQDNNGSLENYKFVNSKDEPLIQVSDVVAGIWGKLTIYVNTFDVNDYRKVVNNLNDVQRKNINLISKLRLKSNNKNPAFLHSVVSIEEIKRINSFFKIMCVKNEK